MENSQESLNGLISLTLYHPGSRNWWPSIEDCLSYGQQPIRWALQANYGMLYSLNSTYYEANCLGYDNEILADATHAANQDAGSGNIIYDGIYNCCHDGEIVWSCWCGGGGMCDKAVTNNAHALCKGEPVDTGREPPYFPPEGEGAVGGRAVRGRAVVF